MEEQARHGEGEEHLDKKQDKKLDMELDMELDMKTSHGRAREEREACARGGDAAQAGARTGPTGRHAGAPGPTPGLTGLHAGPARSKPDARPVPSGADTVALESSSGCHPAPHPVQTGPAGP